jgi:hypothetical protein
VCCVGELKVELDNNTVEWNACCVLLAVAVLSIVSWSLPDLQICVHTLGVPALVALGVEPSCCVEPELLPLHLCV